MNTMEERAITNHRVIADGPLPCSVTGPLTDQVTWIPWEAAYSSECIAVDAVYTYGHPQVDADFLSRLSGVRVISNFGVGVDHIDLIEAKRLAIPVGNTPGLVDGATADMGFALMLAAARLLIVGDRHARSDAFTHYDPSYMIGREVYGQKLGIIGMGRIGLQVALRAQGFSMQVFYHNRRERTDLPPTLHATYLSLDALLSECDFVMLCVPLADNTRKLIGGRELALMKSTAVLINIARGAIVDTDALTETMVNRRIFAAGLDVTDPEPLPRDHPLLRCDNVVIAPHLGSATQQTRQAMAQASITNLLRGIAGQPLLFEVR
jgi:glyoxylate reductase